MGSSFFRIALFSWLAVSAQAQPAKPAPDPVSEIAAELKADPAKIPVVAGVLADFIWQAPSPGAAFADASLRESDLSLEPGKRLRDKDLPLLKQWTGLQTRDAATLYYMLLDGSPHRASLAKAMERWTARTAETFELSGRQSMDGKPHDIPIGPRTSTSHPEWVHAFLADAARQSRRILGIKALPKEVIETIAEHDKNAAPGTLKHWSLKKKKR